MIFVDDRAGSGPFLTRFTKAGLPASHTRLDYGDFAFTGLGPDGTTVSVGIEHKTVDDLIGSIRSGRLTGDRRSGAPGQLHGLCAAYDSAWLLVEGSWRHDDQGRVVQYQGPARGWRPTAGHMPAAELDKHLFSYELCGGVHVRTPATPRDTVRLVGHLYRWWRDVAFDHHGSHLRPVRTGLVASVSPFRQAVMAWPGVGVKSSLALERHFRGSVARAAAAPVEEWAGINLATTDGKSRLLGKAAATKLWTFLHG